MHEQYQPLEIETQAQNYWKEHQSFLVRELPDKEKFYCLSMFPYPSGKLQTTTAGSSGCSPACSKKG